MDLILPKNSKINEVNKRLIYDEQALKIEFIYVSNKIDNDICLGELTSIKE